VDPNFQIASAFSPKTAVAAANDLPFKVLIEKCDLIRKKQAVIARVNVLKRLLIFVARGERY
jgi:hypothetical protein